MKLNEELHQRLRAQERNYRSRKGTARVESGVEVHAWDQDGSITESWNWHRVGDVLQSKHCDYNLAIQIEDGQLHVYAAKATDEPRQMVVDSPPDPVNTMLLGIACSFVWRVHTTDQGQDVFIWAITPSAGFEQGFEQRIRMLGLREVRR